ncbi:MAG: hypothetical protein HC888_11055 [Candidatus Competibacteraceae bacterium]|nr:hypothetical protein [Candidatus Competibacteraceae bacterium]
MDDPSFIGLMDKHEVKYFRVSERGSALINFLISWAVPFIMLALVWRYFFQRMGNMGSNVLTFGKNRTAIVAEGSTGVKFGDVAGEVESPVYTILKMNEALAKLEYTVLHRRGFALVTGDIGSGKTTLTRTLLRRLGPNTRSCLINNTRVEATQLLRLIASEFQLDVGSAPR